MKAGAWIAALVAATTIGVNAQNVAVWYWGPNTNGISPTFPAMVEDIGTNASWAGADAVMSREELRAARMSLNHYGGAVPQSRVEGLASALSGKADVGHTHQGGGASAVNVVRKTNDQVVSTAVVDVTGLSFVVAANTDYAFEFYVVVSTTATTDGYQLTLNGPAIGSGELSARIECPSTATAQTVSYGVTSYGTLVAVTTGPGTARFVAKIHGTLRNGANAGTFTVRARSEVTANGLTVKRGSWGVWF